jgi:polyisoprenoid-binding protein YceI
MDVTISPISTWTIDPAHTRVNFSVRHMMISTVRGEFASLTGTVAFDPQDPGATTVAVQIAADSISTTDPQRDAHLKSPDFLDAEKYPYLTFTSKRVEPMDASRARLVGDLTIRDVTREVVLEVEYHGTAKSPWGATAAGFTATTQISRKDWNLTWNVALETGGVLVADVINIEVQLEIVQQ